MQAVPSPIFGDSIRNKGMEKLLALYKRWRGSEPAGVEKLEGAGSNRAYYRLTDEDGEPVIGVIGTSLSCQTL